MPKKLDLVLLWHMHQPEYRDYATGMFRQAWVYLHAIKDYADMAAHLERHPEVHAVVNFVPVLLDQIEDYAAQFASGDIRDPLLAALVHDPATPLGPATRTLIADRCFRANHEKMVQPYAAYATLHGLFSTLDGKGTAGLDYLSDQYFFDLVTWYHLAWTGETVRRGSEVVQALMAQGIRFTFADRSALFAELGTVVGGIVPRWKALAESGRVEVSSSPHFHPLSPLMIDFASAREARPELSLPDATHYPGGVERTAFHVRSALEEHERRFGSRPAGLWPSEGAVSDALLRVMAAHDVRWAASGEAVLMQSLAAAGVRVADPREHLYRPYRLPDHSLTCFFRDDRLSDLIGFEYAKWNSSEAAAHFVGELERIAEAGLQPAPLVSVILDGENCWEYYPYNGYYFLDELYAKLAAHPRIRTRTFADVVRPHGDGMRAPPGTARLPQLVAGSWVYGDFTTWIGSAGKNRAWDLLCEAKRAFDAAIATGALAEDRRKLALRQLAALEGSDWFWWMGDYNPAHAVTTFDTLYRANLKRLYVLIGATPPASLEVPISHGTGHPEAGGAMRRAS